MHWIKCEGYFSNQIHHGPYWLAWESGKITTIQDRPPEGQGILFEDQKIYLTPLLSDTHVHVYMEPWPLITKERVTPGSKAFEEEVVDALERLRLALKNGVGFVRDMGDPYGINLEVKKRIAQSDLPFPAIQTPGPGMHRPQKYGRYLGVAKHSLEEIKDTIDGLFENEHVDFIKLITTGIVNFEEKRVRQSPQYTIDELSELVEYTHAKGLKVSAHCSGADGVDIAINAGVDFIEHGYFINKDQVKQLTQKGLTWTPTFAPVFAQGHHDECGWNVLTRKNINDLLAEHNQQVKIARHQKTNILVGTDAGCPGVEMGKGVRIELFSMEQSGFTAEELLRLATVNNAARCQVDAYSGSIEVGQTATFGVYTEAPWQKIQNLNALVSVYCQGTLVE